MTAQPDLRILALQMASMGPVAEAMARAIIRTAGAETFTNAKINAPVLTGYLRSTVYVRFDSDGLGFEAGATARYFPAIELGTASRAPRPFLVPAFEQAVEVSRFAMNVMIERLA